MIYFSIAESGFKYFLHLKITWIVVVKLSLKIIVEDYIIYPDFYL